MKKFLRVLFNIFWIILVGLESAVINAVVGAICCVTIIGIPFGLQYFKFIKLVFMPAGRVVVLNYKKHPVLNSLWLVFGGLVVFLVELLLALVCCITIIGIPLGKQLYKIAFFNLAPFGASILWEGDYTEEKDTLYDYELLFTKIAADPSKTVTTQKETCTAGKYVTNQVDIIPKEKEIARKSSPFGIMTGIIGGIIPAIGIISIFARENTTQLIIGIILFAIGILAISISMALIIGNQNQSLVKLYKERYSTLFDLYPNDSPTKKLCYPVKQIAFRKYYSYSHQERLCKAIPESEFNLDQLNFLSRMEQGYCNLNAFLILFNKVKQNPNKKITTANGETTAKQYVNANPAVLEREKAILKQAKLTKIITPIVYVGILILSLIPSNIPSNIISELLQGLSFALSAMLMLGGVPIVIFSCKGINNQFIYTKLEKLYYENYFILYDYYTINPSTDKPMEKGKNGFIGELIESINNVETLSNTNK